MTKLVNYDRIYNVRRIDYDKSDAYIVSAMHAQLECDLAEAEWMQTHIYDKWKKKCYFTQNINKIEVIIDNRGFSVILLYNNKDNEIVATYETEQQAAKALKQLFDGIISEDGRIDSNELNEYRILNSQKHIVETTEEDFVSPRAMYIMGGIICTLALLVSIIIGIYELC